MTSRKYTQSRRLETQRRTRQRIVEAAVTLHERLGPAATTIKAVAEEAGVQRLTVYRHFPDDTALFTACTSHWLALNPPPDRSLWADIADPFDRVFKALHAFYRYYERTQRMWMVSFRDKERVPALAGPLDEFARDIDLVRDDLVNGIGTGARGKRRIVATVGHALQFTTWCTLAEQGLKSQTMAEVVRDWIRCLARTED